MVWFNQVATDEYDYVSIPADKVIGVKSPKYDSFSLNGRRVTAYGVTDKSSRSPTDWRFSRRRGKALFCRAKNRFLFF
ncbi:hypothetical protein [Halorussus ruber]|uniref:hypothetical protein n=1 Tax=Halorussus ruber TaxID=1126238 RepID=UPI0010923D03|nr:hypothetical protein [Halorussus ruber]